MIKQLKLKQFFLAKILSLAFLALLLCPLAAQAASVGEENVANYHKMMQILGDIIKTQDDIAKNQAAGKATDWAAIAEAYGMNPNATPDQISDILASSRTEFEKLQNTIDVYTKAGAPGGPGGIEPKTYASAEEMLSDSFGEGMFNNLLNESLQNYEDKKSAPPPLEVPVGEDKNDAGVSPVFYDVTAMLSALQAQIPQLIRFVKALSWLMGIFFVMAGVMKLKAYGQQTMMSSTHASMLGPLVYITIGSLLIYFPSIFFVVTETLMGGGDSVLSYTPGELSGFGFASLLAVVVAIVRLVGFIAFLKGWVILTKLGSHNGQGGTVGKGIVHIIGGVLAVNIITTWEILRATFGYVW